MSAAIRSLATVLVSSLLFSACAAGAAVSSVPAGSTAPPGGLPIGTASTAALGTFLTGSGGMTLYIFTKDRPNQTTCTGGCAQLWPPLTVPAGHQPQAGAGVTGRLGTLVRPDGGTQATYDGMPLYYYSGDTKAGDTTGQGQGGVWFVAPASGSVPAAASSPSSSGGGYSH
jgi:predicted lipoprotein with Yx(FWY)xxD motif